MLFFTDCVRTESGPVLNSSCSRAAISSGVISDFGLMALKEQSVILIDNMINYVCEFNPTLGLKYCR